MNHICVVQRHLDGKPMDFSAASPYAPAQLRLFARNEIIAIAARVAESGDAYQSIAATR